MKAVVVVFLTVSLLPALAADDQVAESVFLKGSEIYSTKPGATEARQLTTDGLKKGLLVPSKDRRRFAFVRDAKGSSLGDLVVMQPDGTTVREIRFRPPEAHVSGMRFIEGLEWISDQRLVVSGSVNPSTGEYVLVDIGTGKEVGGYLTDGFAWTRQQRPRDCQDGNCS